MVKLRHEGDYNKQRGLFVDIVVSERSKRFLTVLEQVTNTISKLDLPLSKIILFGSVARGDYTIASDIDLAVITTTTISRVYRKAVTQAIAEFEDIDSMLEINCFYATDESLTSANHWSDLCTYIKNEGIVLWQKEAF